MSPDLIAGLLIGAGFTLLVAVKLVAWAIQAAGKLVVDWINQALP